MGGAAVAADLLARVRAEIDVRLAELRPSVAEYERLRGAAGALYEGADAPVVEAGGGARPRPAATPRPAAKPRQPAKPRLGASEQAIVAALEHGSHTVSELAVVTAMSGPDIRESVRRLLRAGKIARARREGRVAYALSDTA